MFKNIGIVGAGRMGQSIFDAIVDNFEGYIIWISNGDFSRIQNRFNRNLSRKLKYGILSEVEYEKTLSRIKFSNKLNDLKNTEFIIETISEDFDKKKSLFNSLLSLTQERAFIGSNSSSILAENINNHQNIFNLHFFYPVNTSKIAEIIISENSSFTKDLIGFLTKLNITPFFQTKENPFIINRLILEFQIIAFKKCISDNISFEFYDKEFKKQVLPIGIFEISSHVHPQILLQSLENYMQQFKTISQDFSFYQTIIEKSFKEDLSIWEQSPSQLEIKLINFDEEKIVISKFLNRISIEERNMLKQSLESIFGEKVVGL